jgi:hypothetical protein
MGVHRVPNDQVGAGADRDRAPARKQAEQFASDIPQKGSPTITSITSPYGICRPLRLSAGGVPYLVPQQCRNTESLRISRMRDLPSPATLARCRTQRNLPRSGQLDRRNSNHPRDVATRRATAVDELPTVTPAHAYHANATVPPFTSATRRRRMHTSDTASQCTRLTQAGVSLARRLPVHRHRTYIAEHRV